jgi:hypothetical protein
MFPKIRYVNEQVLVRPSIFFKDTCTSCFTLGPYAAFHGMALTCHIEVPYEHICGCFKIRHFQFMFDIEFARV